MNINILLDIYYSVDKVAENDDYSTSTAPPSATTLDYLALLNEPGIPPHTLIIKPTMICSLARNLSVERGLVKNARVIVISCEQHSIGVQLISGDISVIYLPRITFNFTPKFSSWSVNRRQFPLRPAYATTFNSCQGLTLDRVVLDLSIPVFTHGQLYTSLSRVRKRSSIAIILNHSDEVHQRLVQKATQHVHEIDKNVPQTLNIVYQELLS